MLDARSGKTPGLAESAEFKALRQYLPAEGNQFFYAGKRFSETLREIQKQAMQSNPLTAGQADFFNRFLTANEAGYSLVVGGYTPSGWQLISAGNHDCTGALLLAPAVGGIAVPAAMLLPALAKAKGNAQNIGCRNNLKQIGLAYAMWASDNGGQFPFNVSTNKGGSLEFCARGDGGFDQNSFRHFRVLSNYGLTPQVFVCPGDSSRKPAADFRSLGAANVTYQVRTGTDVSPQQAQEVLARCPIHGNELHCDGSVTQGRVQ